MKSIGPLYKIGDLSNPSPLILSLYYTGGGGAPAILQRTASIEGDNFVWSGHSLTDAVYFSGTYPGDFTSIHNSVFGEPCGHRKSTIAGSSLQWRWNNLSERVTDISVDEREDIASFHTSYY